MQIRTLLETTDICRLLSGGVLGALALELLGWLRGFSPLEPHGLVARASEIRLASWPLPDSVLAAGSLLIGFAFLLRRRACRQALVRIAADPAARWIALLAWLGTAATLIPGSHGWPMIRYLLVGSIGMGLLLESLVQFEQGVSSAGAGAAIQWPLSAPARWMVACSPAWFAAGVWAAAFALMNLLSWFVFHHQPFSADTVCQLQQAGLFASGRLIGDRAHVPVPVYSMGLIVAPQGWYAMYPPGHSLLLMCGLWLKVPWLVNPLLGSLSVVLLWAVGASLYGEATGRVAAVLGLGSPFLILMSSEFMNHATALCGFLFFLFNFLRVLKTRRVGPALLAGIGLGMVVITRPLTALGLAAPFMAYGCWLCLKRFPAYGRPLLAMAGVVTGFVALFGLYNALTTGSPWLSGYEALYGPGHNPGFHQRPGGWVYTPQQAVQKTLNDLNWLHLFSFGWPLPALALAAVPFVVGARQYGDGLLAASFLGLVAAYFFYGGSNFFYFGPRFLYEGLGPLIVLMARGVQALLQCVEPSRRLQAKCLLTAMGAVCVGWAATVHLPQVLAWFHRAA